MSRHLNTREEIEARIAGNAESLIEALRLPTDYPGLQEYINMRVASLDVLIAARNRYAKSHAERELADGGRLAPAERVSL